MNEDGRGIKTGMGTCVCDEYLKCDCIADTFRQQANDGPGAKERQGFKKLEDRENEVVISDARKGGHNTFWLGIESQ